MQMYFLTLDGVASAQLHCLYFRSDCHDHCLCRPLRDDDALDFDFGIVALLSLLLLLVLWNGENRNVVLE
jgi:hypothetical protein